MAIEQAIYTHTRVRRDTRSTGFGYYSMTAGMEALLKEERRLAAASAGYLSPRNSELWWEQEEQDMAKRGETESQRIKEHHPVSFGYRLFDRADGRIAALTFGKNMGRDLSPLTRDGNILVNTLAVTGDELDRYPYEYYGSSELFLDLERDYFLDAGDSPAPDLPDIVSIGRGCAPSAEEVTEFISEEERPAQLRAMLGALMRINDGGTLKRIIICDNKDNIIYWIAALSLIYPKENAMELTFSTYSFLGSNPDDLSPFYDDVKICGVYTPTVNGDPASRRATNYDPAKEQANPETALFDFEQRIFPEYEDEHPYFGVFIESAYETDMRLLDGYKEFIAEKTSCRSAGSAYAEGYGYYTITRLRNEYSLRYIADAAAFAGKYMDEDALKELFDIAFSCGYTSEEADALFGEVLRAAGSAADDGHIPRGQLAESFAGRLLNCFRNEETLREDYFGLKKKLAAALGRPAGQDVSLERAFIGGLSFEELAGYCTSPCKKWRLAELAGMTSKLISAGADAGRLDAERLKKLLLRLTRRLMISEKNDRTGLMSALLDGLGGKAAADHFCAVFRSFADKPEIRSGLEGCLIDLMLKADSGSLAVLTELADSEGILEDIVSRTADKASETLGLSGCSRLFSDMLSAGGGRLDGYCGRFMSVLRRFRSDESETQQPENIYSVFLFAKSTGGLAGADIDLLVKDYFAAASAVSGRCSIDEETGERLLEMTAASPDPAALLSSEPELGSAEAMLFARVFAEEPDVKAMYPSPDLLPCIDFGDMTEAERYECVREAGNAFCRRSIMLGSAFGVEYKYFIDTEDKRNERITADIFAAWAEELAVIRPQGALRLIGQVLAMSAPYMNGGLLLGNMLYERGISPAELRPYIYDKECLDRIGSASALAHLEKLLYEITEVYESRAVKSPFGKIRSKFGGSKKQKK